MKGKISMYFTAPNVGKIRSRVENPSAEFSKELREDITAATAEVLNEHILDIRAKLIQKFEQKGLTVKDAKKAAALASPLQPFFDVIYSLTPIKDEPGDEETPEAEVEAENDGFED